MPGGSFYRRPEPGAQQASFCYRKRDETLEMAERLRKLLQFPFFFKPALEAPPQAKRERKIFFALACPERLHRRPDEPTGARSGSRVSADEPD